LNGGLSARAVGFFTIVGRLWPEISIVAMWVNVGLFPALWPWMGKHWIWTGLMHSVLIVRTHEEKPLSRANQ
jgi:hypothetical protein